MTSNINILPLLFWSCGSLFSASLLTYNVVKRLIPMNVLTKSLALLLYTTILSNITKHN